MFPEVRGKSPLEEDIFGHSMDDMPDIDDIISSLDDSMISISILKGVGGHAARLGPSDNVRFTSVYFHVSCGRINPLIVYV